MKKIKSTEKNTQKAVIQYLEIKKIFHYRQNSGNFTSPTGHFYKMGVVGMPDIIAVINGQYIGLEIKDIKGKLNDNQVKFKARLEEAGGLYLTIRSIDECIEEINKLI